MNNRTLLSIVKSWRAAESSENTLDELRLWIDQINADTQVKIQKVSLEDCLPWFYDWEEGCIRNQDHSFFTITGCCLWQSNDERLACQPVILQKEIGILGIICQEFNGIMHFLMQAKIEPGNVNKVQISPTLQATKSNFTQKHGGRRPPYLDYFLNASRYELVVDQLQSEQSSRFIGKRNRNILVRVEEPIPVLPSYRWMTLGQIKRLMREDNLVNMDTRTVLSGIPYYKLDLSPEMPPANFADRALFRSIWNRSGENQLSPLYFYINNYKMFSETRRELLPLHRLPGWSMRGNTFVSEYPHPFKVVFCDITMEGREVKHWTQPLFEANGKAVFGLICCEDAGTLKFLVKAKPEVGCFDYIEIGPTIQLEALASAENRDVITQFFIDRINQGQGIIFDQLLSEEGGRFYQEQNRNILLRVDLSELPALPNGYFFLDYRTLNELVQVNNVLNIQLRDLLSLLEA